VLIQLMCFRPTYLKRLAQHQIKRRCSREITVILFQFYFMLCEPLNSIARLLVDIVLISQQSLLAAGDVICVTMTDSATISGQTQKPPIMKLPIVRYCCGDDTDL